MSVVTGDVIIRTNTLMFGGPEVEEEENKSETIFEEVLSGSSMKFMKKVKNKFKNHYIDYQDKKQKKKIRDTLL